MSPLHALEPAPLVRNCIGLQKVFRSLPKCPAHSFNRWCKSYILFTCPCRWYARGNGHVHSCKNQHCWPVILQWNSKILDSINRFANPFVLPLSIRPERVHSDNFINLKDWEQLGFKFLCIPMMSNTSDGMVTDNNLPLCSWFLQYWFYILLQIFIKNIESDIH